MSPQWMPQNIQKRILLYVLQQLSLFSEVELPNLQEVSLNNIVLNNISFDPEKVKKTLGFNLRYGQVGRLELNTMSNGVILGSGGVNIDAKDIEMVISPDIEIEEDLISSALFLLAQSTTEFANTMMSDIMDDSDEFDESELLNQKLPRRNSTSSNSSSNSKKISTLSSVMSKAVEIALARLRVRLENLKIKIISEHCDMELIIDELIFTTKNGVRKVILNGIRLNSLRPDINPGLIPNEQVLVNLNDEFLVDLDNSDDSETNENLSESTLFSHEEASSIYMSAIEDSFDLLAKLKQESKQTNKTVKPLDPVTIFYINSFHMEFEGLNTTSNLKISIDTIKIALTPLTDSVSTVLNGITRNLKLADYNRRKQTLAKKNTTSRFPQYSNIDDIVEEDVNDSEVVEEQEEVIPLFNRIHINNITINMTSALLSNGDFAYSDSINVILDNLNVKQKSQEYIFGGIEKLTFVKDQSEIFSFTNPIPEGNLSGLELSMASEFNGSSSKKLSRPKADIRFEIISNDSKSKEVVVLLSKEASFLLDSSNVGTLLSVLTDLLNIHTSYDVLQSIMSLSNASNSDKRKKSFKTDLQFVFQTSNVKIDLLSPSEKIISLLIHPINFNLLRNKLTISKISLYKPTSSFEEILGYFSNFEFRNQMSEFKTFINRNNDPNFIPREIKMSSTSNLSIEEIFLETSLDNYKLLVDQLSLYFESISHTLVTDPVPEKVQISKYEPLAHSMYLANHRRGIGISSVHNIAFNNPKLNIASLRLNIKKVFINIKKIGPQFDSFRFMLADILFYQLKNDIQGSISTFSGSRFVSGKRTDDLIRDYDDHKSRFPLVFFHCKNNEKVKSVNITIRNLLIDYHTKWLDIFNRDKEKSSGGDNFKASDCNEKEEISKSKGKPSNFDIRISLFDCVLALNPLRLKSKLALVIEKGTADLTFGEYQFYVKSSLRSISLVLIDDISNLHSTNTQDGVLDSSAHASAFDYYLALGYINVGNINVTHIGVTFNTKIENLLQRSNKLGLTDSLALMDIKINSDEHQIELCADSAHALLQLVTDLKLPLNFTDADRGKVEVEGEFDLLDKVNYLEFAQEDVTNKKLEFDTIGFDDLVQQDKDKIENTNESDSTIDEKVSLRFEEDYFIGRNKNGKNKVVPVKFNLNLIKTKIFLYDGYDWKETRKAIKGAVKRVETRAKTQRQELIEEQLDRSDLQEASPIEESLYGSVYLSMPTGAEVNQLTESINRTMQNTRFNESTINRSQLNSSHAKHYKNLKLKRSMAHKVLIDLRSIEVSLTVFTSRDPRVDPDEEGKEFELMNSIDFRLDTITIYDNIPTSTWNKFLSYMNVIGEREIGTSMLKASILNVRPFPKVASTEAIVNVSILPIRLHMDQDTLEFVSRFFEFKDCRFSLPPDEDIYFQNFEISKLKMKIDYKPKTVDYVGMSSGRYGEFINLFTLDGSVLKLPKIKTYGVHGVSNLGKKLGSIWGPEIQRTQIASLIAGLSPLRSVVNIGGGVKNLLAVSYQEYKKDGRLFSSIGKGTKSFAKTTGYEILNLGAKLASGAQVLLEQGEEKLGGEGQALRQNNQLKKSKSSNRKAKTRNPGEFLDFHNIEKPNKPSKSLMESLQMLNQSIRLENDPFGSSKQYSYVDIDENLDGEIDEDDKNTFLNQSILLLDSVIGSKRQKKKAKIDEAYDGNSDVDNDDDDDDDDNDNGVDEYAKLNQSEQQKLISLYSNQPETIEEGIKLAYKSMGKNLSSTKKIILKLKDEVNDAETMQEALITVLKSSPIVLIRPLIGTTEAVSKTLMGLSNEVDPTRLQESKDKYRYDKKSNN